MQGKHLRDHHGAVIVHNDRIRFGDARRIIRLIAHARAHLLLAHAVARHHTLDAQFLRRGDHGQMIHCRGPAGFREYRSLHHHIGRALLFQAPRIEPPSHDGMHDRVQLL